MDSKKKDFWSLQWSLCCLLFYLYVFIIVTSYQSISEFHELDSFQIYFFVLIFFALLYLIKDSLERILGIHRVDPTLIKNKNQLYCILMLVILSIGLKFWAYKITVFNTDEISQYFTSLIFGPIKAGIIQQQPPLDYFFSAFHGTFFKKSQFLIRLHPMVLSTFFFILLFYFLCRRGVQWIASLFYTIAFCTNPIVLSFSVGARPISLALVAGLIFIDHLTQPALDNLKAITGKTFLLLSSIGFQAPVFVAIFFFINAFHLIRNKTRAWKSLIGMGLATLLFLPFQLLIFEYAQSFLHTTHTTTKTFNSVLLYLTRNPSIVQFYIVFPLFISIVILLFRKFKPVRKLIDFSTIRVGTLLTLQLATTLFFSLATVLFLTLVTYSYNYRYLALGLLTFGLAQTFLIEEIRLTLTSAIRSSMNRIIADGAILVAATAFFVAVSLPALNPIEKASQEKIYSTINYLENNIGPNDIVLGLCLTNQFGCWDLNYWSFYVRGEKINHFIDSIKDVEDIFLYLRVDSKFTDHWNFETTKFQSNAQIIKFTGPAKFENLYNLTNMLFQAKALHLTLYKDGPAQFSGIFDFLKKHASKEKLYLRK